MYKDIVAEIMEQGEKTRHIQHFSFSFRGQRVECIYDGSTITMATLIKGDGRFELLNQECRQVILEQLHHRNEEGTTFSNVYG